jgi:hypothetical protein
MPMMYDRYDTYTFGPFHMLVIGLILIIPFWHCSQRRILRWWSLLMIIPLVNLIALLCSAFSSWPSLGRRGEGQA